MTSPLPSRRSIRLHGFDYTQSGLYFITIVTANRSCLFGAIEHGFINLNPFGGIVVCEWEALPTHYPTVELDESVLMPNHFHGLVWLHSKNEDGRVSAPLRPAPTRGENGPLTDRAVPLSEVVRAFKSYSARKINVLRHTPGRPVWQRGYYEHIVRDDSDGDRILEYIRANPDNWETDLEYLPI